MKQESKIIIQNFIDYLYSDSQKCEFKCGGWNYDNTIYDFIDFCYNNDIILEYDSAQERMYLQQKNIEEMSIDEIRKYLYVIFNGERFASGMIAQSISNNKLKKALEKLATYFD